MDFKIEIDRQALKTLKSLAKPLRRQITNKIEALQKNPYPSAARKIQGQKGLFRIRQGNFRIAYTVIEDRLKILVVHIGDRRDFYTHFKRVHYGG